MSLEFIVTGIEETAAAVDGIQKAVEKGADKGIREATRGIRARMRERFSHSGSSAPVGYLGMRSGETRRALRAGYFKENDGSLAGRVYISSKSGRSHIGLFNEKGTRDHGKNGPPLIARLMFATERQGIRESDIAAFIDAGISKELAAGLLSLF